MKKLLFACLFFASCTRYVYVLMPTQIKEVEKPAKITYWGDNMQFDGSVTLPYRPFPNNSFIGAIIHKDSTQYFTKVDSMFFAAPKHGIKQN